VSGQLCRVAEGLSYKEITLAHRCPSPSPHKSDTCANPVQKFSRPQRDILLLQICTIREFGVVKAGTN
jgi:hypothetical protein